MGAFGTLQCKRDAETDTRVSQRDPSLWIQALTYFASKERECRQQIQDCLQIIDKGNILPPLIVVKILGKNDQATLAVAKDYIIRHLQQVGSIHGVCRSGGALTCWYLQDISQIAQDEKEVQELREKTNKMREEIKAIQTKWVECLFFCMLAHAVARTGSALSKCHDAILAGRCWICLRCIFCALIRTTSAAWESPSESVPSALGKCARCVSAACHLVWSLTQATRLPKCCATRS
jgi:hypothetical protein